MIPIIKTLQVHSPMTNITWIIGKTEYHLVKNIKNIDFIVINKRNFIETIKVLLSLRKRKYFDVLLHMQVSLRSNLMTLFICFFFIYLRKQLVEPAILISSKFLVLLTFRMIFLFLLYKNDFLSEFI